MSLDDYKVKVADKRSVENGAKLTVELVEKDSDNSVNKTVKGVSDRQLDKDQEYWNKKMRRWAEQLYNDYKADKKDVPVEELEL